MWLYLRRQIRLTGIAEALEAAMIPWLPGGAD
jgi:pyridoxine/pyridoxamine 5'-phosphate oxidase